MIDEAKVLKEVRWLETEVEHMKHPTKTEFLRAIQTMKKRMECEVEDFPIPSFLRRLP